MSRGIVYVAWGNTHCCEAVDAAIRNRSGYPTCLITDLRADSPHFAQFDVVKNIDFSPFDAMDHGDRTKYWRKQAALIHSPFDVTCYLDADCTAVGNLDLGFELAEEGNFCNVIAPTMWFELDGKKYVLYNGGVWFAKTPAPHIIEAFRALIPTVGQKYLGDEGVISVACRQGTFKHAVLPKSFNLPLSGHHVNEQIRVIHTRHPVGNLPQRITTDYWGHEVIER